MKNKKYSDELIMEWKQLLDQGISAQKIKEMYHLEIPRQNIYSITKYRTDPEFREKAHEACKRRYHKSGGHVYKNRLIAQFSKEIDSIFDEMQHNDGLSNKVTQIINYEFLFGKYYACMDMIYSILGVDEYIKIAEATKELKDFYQNKTNDLVNRLYMRQL